MHKEIYLIRHGQTEFNAARRLQGQCDSPLTALGQQQAQAIGLSLAQRLAGQSWPIIASPLGRAAASAQLIAAQLHHPVLSFDQRLMEVSLGQWEQRQLDELLAHKPPALNSREYYLTAPGAESLLQVQQRLLAWLGDANTPARCVVVSHGLTGMILRGLLLQLSAEQLWQQDVPQDAYYYLNGGHIERIDVGLSPKR